MKSLLVFFAMFVFASARPGALIHTHVIQAPIVSAPLLTKIEGQAPASTIHAVHAKLVPQVIAYSSVPHIVSTPIVSSPVISAYSVPAPLPFVSFSSINSIESLHSFIHSFSHANLLLMCVYSLNFFPSLLFVFLQVPHSIYSIGK